MKRTTGVRWGNLKTGLILIVALAAMLWASLSGGGTSIFEDKASFICYFRNVNGLVSGAPVWMSGVEVGNTRSVSFVNLDSLRQVKIVCRIKRSVWHMLTEGSEVQLGTIGFLGDKYIEIIPGPRDGMVLSEMDVIGTRDVGDAAAMFKAGEDAIGDVRSVAGGLDAMLERMNRGEGTLGRIVTDDKLYVQVTALTSQLTVLAADLQKNQERLTASLEKTATAVGHLSEQVSSNTGTLGRLVNDPALYDNLAAASARLDSVMSRLNSAEGSLGLLVSDTALYVQMTNLMARLNNLVIDIEANPRKYFKFSIF